MNGYTPQDLRTDIRAAELLAAELVSRRSTPRSGASRVLELLTHLDRIAAGTQMLGQIGVDLRSERTRIDALHHTLRDKSRVIVRSRSSWSEISRRRTTRDIPAGHWWWHLDQYVAGQRRRRAKRLLWRSGVIACVIAAAISIYALFFRPDSTTRRRYHYLYAAEADAQNGDYASALENYRRAGALAANDDAEINLMIAVMYDALERHAEAETQYARAIQLYETPALFMSVRSQKYSALGWYGRAVQDALEATRLDAQLALGYCALGSAYAGQQEYRPAIDALNTCADLAYEQGQDELYVVAKSRLAMLLQNVNR